MKSIARSINRIPAQRDTLYRILKVFDNDTIDPLDLVDERQFGSYHELIRLDKFRFKKRDVR
jgi:FO synthase subunit 2